MVAQHGACVTAAWVAQHGAVIVLQVNDMAIKCQVSCRAPLTGDRRVAASVCIHSGKSLLRSGPCVCQFTYQAMVK